MIRWKYVAPRLLIVIAIFLAVYFGTNPLLRWSLIKAGQSATGAKVDIGWVDTRITDGSIQVEGIQIADPNKPDRNLIEADTAKFNMSVDGLLRRKFIVEEGHLHGVRFGTERETSGALPEAEPKDEEESALTRRAKEIVGPWMKDMRGRLEETALEQSETAQVAEDLIERWPAEYASVRSEADEIKLRVLALRKKVEEASENPLRNLGSFQQSMEEFPSLSQDIQALYVRLDELVKQVPADRQAILLATERDKAKLSKLVETKNVDGEQISQIALGESNGTRVHQVTQWLQWVRSTVPDPKRDFVPDRMEGTNYRFGESHEPDILIRHLSIDGSGQLDGDHYQITGTLEDITTQPRLYGKPTIVKLRAEGPKTLLLTAELDRTSQLPRDRFRLVCPDLDHGLAKIGSADSMQFELEGGKTRFECSLIMQGDQLAGEIRIAHEDVAISVDQVDDSLGGKEVQSILATSLQDINSFDVTLRLSGTLEDPKVTADTDFGVRVAEQIESAFSNELRRRVEHSMDNLDQLAQSKIEALEADFWRQHGEVLESLNIGANELGQIREVVTQRLSFGSIR